MRIEHLPDGSLQIHERWRLMRFACAAAAVLAPAAVLWAAWLEGSVTWRQIGGAALGLVLPGAMAFLVADRRFGFDAATRVLSWEIASWLRRRHGQMPFADIQGVVVSCTMEPDDDSARRYPRYTATLMTRSGPLVLTGSSGSYKPEYDALADSVRAVVGLPAADADAAIQQLVSAGRIVEAVALLRAQRGIDLAAARAVVEQMRRGGRS